MSEQTALTPIEQKVVDFYGDSVTAVRVDDGTIYVPVRPICDLIGVTRQGQQERIARDPILSEASQSIVITDTSGSVTLPQGRSMLCIPLDYLNGWLFGINANRVKESVRESLLKYQRDCYRVLFEAFGRNQVTARPDNELMTSDDPAAVAYRNALELANIARDQYYLTRRVSLAETVMAEYGQRLDLIEAQLSNPERFLDESQCEQIAAAVKLIGANLSQQSGKNEYGSVYGQFYSKFGVTSYKRLPAAKFEDAMGWLRQWWQKISSDSDVPF